MRLARRALFAALATLILLSAVTAQTLRPGNDPRNQAPTVGTGGSPGGPTGLFTIYDGDTLRKGEFTFSIAYSNYDRDPGNVDISVIPLSVNVGINDHLELFFSTEGYRGVKVNNPVNLSSFYLPNSQLFFGPGTANLRSGAAIIIAPERVSGATGISGFGTVFRPAGNQPFVQFPFVGQPGPNFGLTGNRIAPPFTSRLGTPTGQEQGNFSAASNFPGMGSPCGSILPGVVLTTRTIPANLTFNAITVPDLFTICPTYIADAPFINRLYGESAFGTMQAGAKVRFTGPNNPLGVGLVAFYRWYTDKADDFSGFNQLQRGASPGGDIGDFGLVGFVSGRLSRSVSLHSNFGYILNSNPQSEAFGTGKVTLLDRPDELVAGVGADFVVNRHFQIIGELKSVHYTGGRTPNAFQNNPVDFLGGIRVFPRRWFGFSAAYRGHLNQQGKTFTDIFGDDEPNNGFPAGFQSSDDPHGFIFQFFAGRRNEREIWDVVFNLTQPEDQKVSIPYSRECRECEERLPNCPPPPTATTVKLTASVRDAESVSRQTGRRVRLIDEDIKANFFWTWEVTSKSGTQIVPVVDTKQGGSSIATLDLSGVKAPATFQVTATASYACGIGAACTQTINPVTITVEYEDYKCCKPKAPPTLSVSCPPGPVYAGDKVTLLANVSGGDYPDVTPSCSWDIPGVPAAAYTPDPGNTCKVTMDTTGLGGRTITATVTAGGYPPECAPAAASCSFPVLIRETPCRRIDEYSYVSFNDEKARLDNFAIELQNDPNAHGYYYAYGTAGDSRKAAQRRAEQATDYLINVRGIGASRFTAIDAGSTDADCIKVLLWVCRVGAPPPTSDPNDPQVKSILDGISCRTAQRPNPQRTKPRPARRRGRRPVGS